MNKTSALFVGTVAAALLLSATPVLADENGSGHDGMHLGTFVSSFVHDLKLNLASGTNVTVGQNDNDRDNDGDKDDHGANKHMNQNGNIATIGTVGAISGSSFTLNTVKARGGATGTVNVALNGSTTIKSNATTSAVLTSGERVLVIGTPSTSTPNTITASFVIILQNVGHFFSRLFNR